MKYIVSLFLILTLLSCQGKKSNDSDRKLYPFPIVVAGNVKAFETRC